MEKYLKYKRKYLNLKKMIAGSKNAHFEYSSFDDTYFTSRMYDIIDEFNYETNDMYKNDSLRDVNLIQIGQEEKIIQPFRSRPKKKTHEYRNLLSPDMQQYIVKDNWKDYFSYIIRFYNSTTLYNTNQLNSGVIVGKSNLNDVFKPSFMQTQNYNDNITKNENNYNGTYRKGFGNDNFYCSLLELKLYKPNIKFLYLWAKGDIGLVEYYKKIGFTIHLENVIAPYEHIMFGNYDEIIEKLKKNNTSDCIKKL